MLEDLIVSIKIFSLYVVQVLMGQFSMVLPAYKHMHIGGGETMLVPYGVGMICLIIIGMDWHRTSWF